MNIHLISLIFIFLYVATNSMAMQLEPLGAGYFHLLVISTDNNVLSCGLGRYGALGHDTLADIFKPNQPQAIKSLMGKNPVQVAAGEEFSLVLLADGSVYSFGHGRSAKPSLPKKIAGLINEPIIQIAAASDMSLVLTKDGRVLSNIHHFLNQSIKPVAGLLAKHIKKIALGDYDALALDDRNSLFLFTLRNVVSDRIVGSEDQPYEISALGDLKGESTVDMALSGTHALILTKAGHVLSFAVNKDNKSHCQAGPLGISDNHLPKKIETIKDKIIAKIAAGEHCSAFIDDNGNIYAYGKIKSINTPYEEYFSPTKLARFDHLKIIDVKLSKSMLFALDNHGIVHTYGDFLYYVNNDLHHIYYPDEINGVKRDIWTKDNHLFQPELIKKIVYTMMLLQRTYITPKPPKPIIFVIFTYLLPFRT